MKIALSIILVLVVPFLWGGFASALDNPGGQLEEVGVQPILGNKVDFSGYFTDSSGNQVLLSDIIRKGIPAIFVPVYFDCPRLCGLVLNGLIDLIGTLELKFGSEYQVVVPSFDPTETAQQAQEKKTFYSAKLSKQGINPSDWHFLVGSEENVKKLMRELGFRYSKDGEEYAHSSAIILLTPEGEISQYFTGIEYPAWDVRLALVEASQGKIGSALDHVMLFCFRFDQLKGKYTWATLNLLRVGAALTVVFLVGLIFHFYRKERAKGAASVIS